jgi:hypothetical protein
MKKFIGTLAVLVTLAVQIAALSDMATREHPPPFLQFAMKIPSEVLGFFSEEYRTNPIAFLRPTSKPESVPEGYFQKGVYAFHETTVQAWVLWGIITLAVSIASLVCLVGLLIYGTVISEFSFRSILAAVVTIGIPLMIIPYLLMIKTLWLLVRWGYQFLFG